MRPTLWGRSAPRLHPRQHEHAFRLATSGDERAFALLVTAISPRLQHFAEGIVHDSEYATDAVQRAWLAAWEARRTFASVDHLTAWLFQVVRCRAISTRRRRRRTLSVMWSDEPGEEPGQPSPAAREPHVLPTELRERVAAYVARLPEPYRVATTLRYLQGQSLVEVARLLGVPTTTVKMRLHRARAWLRQKMAHLALR